MNPAKDLDHERALIGSLAYAAPEAALAAVNEHGLSEALLGVGGHREVFRVVVGFAREGQRARVGAVFERLSPEARKAVREYQGLAKMCAPDWLDTMPGLPELSRELKAAAYRRTVLAMLEEARTALHDGRAGAVEQLRERLENVASMKDLDHELRAWRPLREVVMGQMLPALMNRDAAKRKREGAVPTGLTRLDDMLDGGAPRSLWVLGADPGAGKTGFMVRCSLLQAAAGMTVGVMPMEDPAERIYGRPVAEKTSVPWHVLTSKDMSPEIEMAAHDALNELHNAGERIFVTQAGRTSPTEVLARLEQLYVMTNGDLDQVWLDNSNEVRLPNEDHHRQMDDLLLSVREWSHRRKVSACFLSHLRRDERKLNAMIRQADFAHTAGFCRLGRLVLGLRQTDQCEESALAVDMVKGNEYRPGWSMFLAFAERGAMPLDREARMKPRKKERADKQAKLFGGKGEAQPDAA